MAVRDGGDAVTIADKIGLAGKSDDGLACARIGCHRIGRWLAASERRKFSVIEADDRRTLRDQFAREGSARRSPVDEYGIERPRQRVRSRCINGDRHRLAPFLVESAEIDQ